jgi:hypothetical protein
MESTAQLQITYIRTREAYLHLVYELNRGLPPIDGPPELEAQRTTAMIERIASLCPVNQAEATYAAQAFITDAQATACMRLANDPSIELAMRVRCMAQAAAMTRQSQAATRTLLRLQEAREKRDSNPKSADTVAWVQHIATSHMTDDRVPPEPHDEPEPYEEPVPEEDLRAEVAHYEAIYPERAALIRRHGGVPHNVTFGPPEPHIVEALLAGPTEHLVN